MRLLVILIIPLVFALNSCSNKKENNDESNSSSSTSPTLSDNATSFTVTVSEGKYFLDGTQAKSLKFKLFA